MSHLQQNTSQQRSVQSYVFGTILVLLFIAVCSIMTPFFSVLLWALLLYMLLRPLHNRMTRKLNMGTRKGKILRSFWAVFFSIGTMLIIFIPLSFVLTIFFRQIMEIITYFYDRLDQNPEYLHDIFEQLSVFIRNVSVGQIELGAEDIEYQIRNFLAAQLQYIVQLSSGIAKNIGVFLFNMLLVVFSMFFFFLDGPYLSMLVQNVILIRTDYFSVIASKFMETIRTLFLGYIIVALIQSVLAFIIFTIFGVDGALALTVIVFVVVFIPMLGAPIVYLPLTIGRIANGDIVGGIVFFAVSSILISGTDNILRPFFLKDRIQLHPLIIFFAILGGLAVFGFNGLILGPTLVILFLTVLDLFLAEHKIKKQELQGEK
jgi:predicted PurR-regulated permease PerM